MGMGERNTEIGGFYKEYVAGMMAGLATVAVGHPFDTVKVLNFPIPIFDFYFFHLCVYPIIPNGYMCFMFHFERLCFRHRILYLAADVLLYVV